MQKEDKKTVLRVMRRSFPLIQQWFFSFSKHVLVAEENREILGAIIMKIFLLPGKHKAGLLYWGFTDPKAQGKGIGRQLFEAGMSYLKEKKCDEIMGCVEGNNTSSSNLLAVNGFSIISPGQQIRRYGFGFISLWLRIFHYLDVGHFLWVRPATEKADHPVWQWWGVTLMNIMIFTLSMWITNMRWGGFSLTLEVTLTPSLMILLLFGVRTFAMRFTGRCLKLDLRYRAWESGFPLSIALALVMGFWYPIPGSYYPNADVWRYKDQKSRLGLIALMGIIAQMFLMGAVLILSRQESLSESWKPILNLYQFIGKPMLVFDGLFIFFPFVSFNGRRIWNWRWWVWVLVAGLIVFMIFV